MIEIEVDSAEYDRALYRLREIVGREFGPLILKEEARQLIKGVMRRNNKLATMHTKYGATAKAVRVGAVERAIKRTMRPLKADDFSKQKFRAFVERINRYSDTELANEVFRRIKSGPLKNAVAVKPRPQIHRSNIGARGQTHSTNYRVIGSADQALLSSYISTVKERVGWKFAGWLPAARQLELSMPKWISRHAVASGVYQAKFSGGNDDYISFWNNASKDSRMPQELKEQVPLRMKAMSTKISRLTRGTAANLGFMTFEPGVTVAQHKSLPEFTESFTSIE